MSKKAIRVENLGKFYRLGAAEPYLTLRDAMDRVVRAPARLLGRKKKNALPDGEIFWSLDDVSFEVKPGEILSIIGHNGSGKSTLLKILAGITEPSKGHADVYGRVAALLELGSGFHSELSGRENIYLNGAILGMRRTEIDRKLDEIIAFAEVEKFIDQPMKYYSSGMFVRLGFSVAAHLEPQILLVDEVLSVGDLSFQRKCQERIAKFTAQGRTVVVVSHDLETVQHLSHRVLLLAQGRMVALGPPRETVERYRALVS